MPKGRPNLGRYLTTREVALIRELRADGYTLAQVASVVGCSDHRVQHYAPGKIGKVPVGPLREAFLASPMTAADVARELGWWCHNNKGEVPDSSRVKRTLGLIEQTSIDRFGRRHRSRRTLVDAETVQRIADIIGIAWWTVMPDDDRPAWAKEDEAA
jgi:AraC-like DNA-binding protein